MYNGRVIKILKQLFVVLFLAILSFSLVKWLFLFLMTTFSLSYLFLLQIVQVNWQNLAQALEIKFPFVRLDIYRTAFPLVFPNPQLVPYYKTVRLILVYLASLLSCLFFFSLLFKLSPAPLRTSFTKRWEKIKYWFVKNRGKILLTTIVATLLFTNFLFIPVYRLYTSFYQTVLLANNSLQAFKNQDFSATQKGLVSIKKETESAQKNLKNLFWLKAIPYLNNYYFDLENVLVASQIGIDASQEAVEILPTVNPNSLGEIDKFLPKLEKFSGDFSKIKEKLDKIDPQRYPENLGNKPLRAKIILGKAKFTELEKIRQEFSPLLPSLPKILGSTQPSYYLLAFENEDELKFIKPRLPALGLFRLEKGKITPLGSQAFWQNLQASDSLDFMRELEKTYITYYRGIRPDGILMVDRKLIVNLFEVLGPTVVYDKVLTTETVRTEIDQLSQNNPREIVGLVLNAALLKSLSLPKESWPQLINVFWQASRQNHLLFYLSSTNHLYLIPSR